MFNTKIISNIDAIDKSLWDSLTDDDVYMCYDYLKVTEEVMKETVDAKYILIYCSNKLAGASVGYFEQKNHLSYLDNTLLGRASSVASSLGISFLPAFSCGPQRGYGTHILINKQLSTAEQENVMESMVNQLERMAKEKHCPISFANVMHHEKALISILEKKGYLSTLGLPVNYLDIEWDTFDGYKKSFSEKKSGKLISINHEINKNKKQGVRISECLDIIKHSARIYDLLVMNHEKYNKVAHPFKENYIECLRKNFGENLIVYVAEKNGQIIGMSITLKHGSMGGTQHIGVDYELAKNDFTYFNIGYYGPIEGAINGKFSRLYYGNAVYFAKARRGCKAEDTYIFYKFPNKLSMTFLKVYFRFHRFWMLRKFKAVRRVNP